ncbi:MAG: M28 family peptidase, partial [candidate division Zixibacteria bacterium]|nr:M28 family peptidase [candidate division Zixibacteria bacterium]
MKLSKCLCICCCLVVLGGGSVAADDLAKVNLASRYQADVVAGIVTSAYSRVGNQFVVAVNEEQATALSRAGIEFEVIMEAIDPARTFIARHSDGRRGVGVDVPQLGETVQLESDVHIVRMSPSIALSLTRTTELTLTSLEERTIPIGYIDPVIGNTLSMVTDFPTDSLTALVSQDSIYAFNTRLEDFETRYIFTDSIHAARDWMVQKFIDWGYTDITTPQFYYGSLPCYNVKVVKPGYAEPDKVIVIGGHYDAITYGQPTDPMDYAPGSDDNASGTTITLEMARILANVPMRKTIIFMPFSAEEVGLYGSYDAAGDFYNAGTDLEVMFNYDMVGYNGNGLWQFEISSGPNTAYRDMQVATCNRVNSQLIPIASPPGGSSDHAAFMNYGFDVVNNIEEDFNYDGWHTNLDLTSRMDFDYMYEVGRMTVASLAIVGNSAQPTNIDQIVDQGDGQSLEVFFGPCNASYEYTLIYGTSPG